MGYEQRHNGRNAVSRFGSWNRKSWADLYDSLRATPFVTQESIKNNLDVGKHWVLDRLKGIEKWSVDDVKPGEGKIITLKGERSGFIRMKRAK